MFRAHIAGQQPFNDNLRIIKMMYSVNSFVLILKSLLGSQNFEEKYKNILQTLSSTEM